MTTLIDAHVHLWNRATDPQTWIDPVAMAAIDRDFTAADLATVLAGTGCDAAVVVQATNSIEETRRLLDDPGPGIAGVVGWIDLTGDAAAQLDSLPASRLVGIRHLVHVDPDPDWLGRPEVGAGLDVLAARGLGFDLVLRPWQLPLALTVATRRPAVRFVLDHLGGIAESTDDAAWETDLRALAARPQVYAKISGLAALTTDPLRLRRVVAVALEAFGPDRLMYGSDWPMTRLSVGAETWRAAVEDLTGDLSPGERQAILAGTAIRCYGLDA